MIFRSYRERCDARQELAAQDKPTITAQCLHNKHENCEADICCCICHETVSVAQVQEAKNVLRAQRELEALEVARNIRRNLGK